VRRLFRRRTPWEVPAPEGLSPTISSSRVDLYHYMLCLHLRPGPHDFEYPAVGFRFCRGHQRVLEPAPFRRVLPLPGKLHVRSLASSTQSDFQTYCGPREGRQPDAWAARSISRSCQLNPTRSVQAGLSRLQSPPIDIICELDLHQLPLLESSKR